MTGPSSLYTLGLTSTIRGIFPNPLVGRLLHSDLDPNIGPGRQLTPPHSPFNTTKDCILRPFSPYCSCDSHVSRPALRGFQVPIFTFTPSIVSGSLRTYNHPYPTQNTKLQPQEKQPLSQSDPDHANQWLSLYLHFFRFASDVEAASLWSWRTVRASPAPCPRAPMSETRPSCGTTTHRRTCCLDRQMPLSCLTVTRS
ncbi:hypothetical protein B0H12DRAFT_31645 [Mycena haematopus]|nr:hypothetical protein B0H12DRAFT_31645 [Mycena haematopus]